MRADRYAKIANRAYHIWEAKGRPDGNALDHWLQAEAEMAAKAASPIASAAQKPSEPAQARRKRRQGKAAARS